MSILQNAINSIVIGIEDYQMEDEKRVLSATRNIFAGILLLFKHKLFEISPHGSDGILIKKKIEPKIDDTGNLILKGKGNATVDFDEIQQRFKSLKIGVDWTRINKIRDYRNNIEHFYSTESRDAVQAIISECFIVIRDFISQHLDEDPKEMLGENTWNALIEITEVYWAEKEECINRLRNIDWMSEEVLNAVIDFPCEECSSDLITVNEQRGILCKSCNKTYDLDEIIELALVEKYGHYYPQDGEEPELIECANCGKDTYLMLVGQCQVCGEGFHHTCQRCGCNIPAEEINESEYCGYCDYMIEKMQNE